MPRPKKEGAPEPKRRSRNGCWPCKARKVKCGEEKPKCLNCERQGETCDYSIRLNWGGRSKKGNDDWNISTPLSSPHSSIFPTPEALGIRVASPAPSATYSEPDVRPAGHRRKRSNLSLPPEEQYLPPLDPLIFPRDNGPPISNFDTPGTFDRSALLLNSFRRQHSFDLQQNHRRITSAPIDPRIDDVDVQTKFAPVTGLHTSPMIERAGTPNASMLPPFSSIPNHRSPFEAPMSDFGDHEDQDMKRMRYSPHMERSPESRYLHPSIEGDPILYPPTTIPFTSNDGMSFNFATTGVLTPGLSYDDAGFQIPQMPPLLQTQGEHRRLSVQDLLSGPAPDDILTPETPDSWPGQDLDSTQYGFDLGKVDEDLPENNDAKAISLIGSPEAKRLVGSYFWNSGADDADDENGDRPIAFNRGGYYAKPVAIKIPKSLEPLPPTLLENPMNLLYFHHFLNHTARILVPHDCEQNPFRGILPQMAIKDENVLNLMLAYSAAHRARLLCQKEPSSRIASYVQDVFPRLRAALGNAAEQVSSANLASAIMLASLEIMSPNTFALHISWQNHLNIARSIVSARGGASTVHRADDVPFFLSRWFAYLDVIGSLSGRKNDWPLSSSYWYHNANDSTEEEFQIDCLLGFTTRCVGILARIAELAKSCEKERINSDGSINSNWRPTAEIVSQAEKLKQQLQESRGHVGKVCTHRRPNMSESEMAWDSLEIYATNEAFHWAGLIHLTRRILGRPSSDPEVQNAVREIIGALYKVRFGSTAEACLLFPMFTAGCDALDAGQRSKIMERLKSVEGFGMTHVKKARTLMEKVWDTGKPWESLVSDEFFG